MIKRDINKIKSDIEFLRKSQLYYLMGHANELNFSDWFKWLFVNEPKVLQNILKMMTNKELTISEFARESEHMDIVIKTNQGIKIVIENKVKSIPMPKQLNKYSEKVNSNDFCFLLSLTNPVFFSNGEYIHSYIKKSKRKEETIDIKWRYISYKDLLSIIDRAFEMEDKEFKKSQYYIDFNEITKSLCKIVDEFKFDFLSESIDEILQFDTNRVIDKINLRTLYEKYFSAMLLIYIYNRLTIDPNEKMLSDEWKEANEGELLCWAGFSSKKQRGLCEFKYIFRNDKKMVVLGVQIVGDEFSLFVETNFSNGDKIAEKLVGSWFDFNDKRVHKKQFYSYKDFKYQFINVGKITPDQVFTEVNRYINYLVSNHNNLKTIIFDESSGF